MQVLIINILTITEELLQTERLVAEYSMRSSCQMHIQSHMLAWTVQHMEANIQQVQHTTKHLHFLLQQKLDIHSQVGNLAEQTLTLQLLSMAQQAKQFQQQSQQAQSSRMVLKAKYGLKTCLQKQAVLLLLQQHGHQINMRFHLTQMVVLLATILQ